MRAGAQAHSHPFCGLPRRSSPTAHPEAMSPRWSEARSGWQRGVGGEAGPHFPTQCPRAVLSRTQTSKVSHRPTAKPTVGAPPCPSPRGRGGLGSGFRALLLVSPAAPSGGAVARSWRLGHPQVVTSPNWGFTDPCWDPAPQLQNTGLQGPEPTQAAAGSRGRFQRQKWGSPSNFPPPPSPMARQHRVRPQRAPPLPASAATFRGARPAGPPRAAVTRWGVSAAVTATWPPARASRASRAARAPHPQACGETGRSQMRFRGCPGGPTRAGAGPGGGARPSENPSEAQPPRSGGPEVARAANSGVGGGQSQGPGAGGASPLNGGDGTAVGSGDGKRVGSTPRGAGGAARTPRGPVASI